MNFLFTKMGEMTKFALVQSLMELPVDIIKEARRNLFTKIMAVCKARCNARNIATPQQPYLKLKSGEEISAHQQSRGCLRCDGIHNPEQRESAELALSASCPRIWGQCGEMPRNQGLIWGRMKMFS